MTTPREEYLRLADRHYAASRLVNRSDQQRHEDTIIATALRSAASIEPGEGWRPKLGDAVEVCPSYKHAEDWRGWHGFICGINAVSMSGDTDLTTSDEWPPAYRGVVTDGWSVNDLRPLPSPPQGTETGS